MAIQALEKSLDGDLKITLGEEKGLILDTKTQQDIRDGMDRISTGNNTTLIELAPKILEAIDNNSIDKGETDGMVGIICDEVIGKLNMFWYKEGPVTERAVDEQTRHDNDFYRETGFWNKLEKDLHEVACAFVKRELEELQREIEG